MPVPDDDVKTLAATGSGLSPVDAMAERRPSLVLLRVSKNMLLLLLA